MTFVSCFAGMGGFDAGLEAVGMQCVLQIENDRHCQTVLHHHWPKVSKKRDISRARCKGVTTDIVCGGSPCQDLSVAGKRAGLAGKRSGLFFHFVRVIGECSPRWVLWENVPGAFSSHGGRDFAVIVDSLVQLGYGVAWRVLDSQYFGLAQRRERVFIVGCLGDPASAAKVLLEPESVCGDSPPSRSEKQDIAACVRGGTESGSNEHGNKVATIFRTAGNCGPFEQDDKAAALNTQTDPSQQILLFGGNNTRGPRAAAAAVNAKGGSGRMDFETENFVVNCLDSHMCMGGVDDNSAQAGHLIAHTLRAEHSRRHNGIISQGVRRLTPLECLRLQGFPDDWLDIEGLSDSAKYRMLGNAVSTPVIRWIGERILAADRNG